jgi:hypothetical protein
MKEFQIENLYKANGITDFKLSNTEELMKVHGIDFKQVEGYNRLDDLNKHIYENFIINIFNAFGLESRSELIPRGIYYVEEIDHLVKEYPEDDYFTVAGGIVYIIDRSGVKTVLREWKDEDYKHLEVKKSESKNYLRFEYEHGTYDDGTPRKEWLHVINEGKEWY